MQEVKQHSGNLMQAIWPEAGFFRSVLMVIAASWFIALTAQISLPMWPVPLTGQTFGVLLVAALLGSRLGALSVLAYLIQGGMGLPFFAGGAGGPAVLVGPTAGYLWGFVVAAFVVGYLAERGWDRQVGRAVVMMFIGTAVIYLFGVSWLTRFAGLETAVQGGLVPFIPGDILKAIAAALLLPSGWKLLNRR